MSTPSGLEVDTPPDGTQGSILAGTYIVVNISGNPVYVSSVPDGNYDLIFYEITNPASTYPVPVGATIALDHIIIGISRFSDGSYYEVFNWGNNVRDANTNVDTNTLLPDSGCTVGTPECDNRVISTSNLYPAPGTGILIDVDTAQGAPPGDTYYNYIVIISPNSGDPNDPAEVDSIVVIEVPIPPPVATP